MTNTGIIRKIDDLGRIVIPKEIRTSLNIKNGEDLAISIENQKIILEKFNLMDSIKDSGQKVINSVLDLTDGTILLTDKSKIITKGPLENIKIPSFIANLLEERKSYTSKESEQITLGENVFEGYFTIKTLLKESSTLGALILFKSTPFVKEDILFVDILKNIIENS